MRVLFAADTSTWRVSNPYLLQLMEAVAQTKQADVFYGVAPLYWPADYDVIHFQWPETAFAWKVPTRRELDRFRQVLEHRKRRSKIVVTVHNFGPRGSFGEVGQEVYDTVYSAADVFIHLTDYSRAHLARARPAQQHVVVPHGDYPYYRQFAPDHSAVDEALGHSADKMILVFGALRTAAEEALARNAFAAAAHKHARLVFAGALEATSLPREITQLLAARQDADVVRMHRRIPDSQVGPLVSASRFVFLPRSGRLNSGVVPLAFTFDRPVIVPDDALSSGLSELGLPTYVAGDVLSAARAIEKALSMEDAAYDDLSDRIREYRSKVMNWQSIGQQHLQVYLRHRQRRTTLASLLKLRRD